MNIKLINPTNSSKINPADIPKLSISKPVTGSNKIPNTATIVGINEYTAFLQSLGIKSAMIRCLRAAARSRTKLTRMVSKITETMMPIKLKLLVIGMTVSKIIKLP